MAELKLTTANKLRELQEMVRQYEEKERINNSIEYINKQDQMLKLAAGKNQNRLMLNLDEHKKSLNREYILKVFQENGYRACVMGTNGILVEW